jgi:hypothetical protein
MQRHRSGQLIGQTSQLPRQHADRAGILAALATTAVSVTMTFAEPIQPGLVRGCPITPMDGLCRSGEVIPFGHATDTVQFGAGLPGPRICNDSCNLRTINLPQGSIISDELFGNPVCPGHCVGPHKPQFGTLRDVIIAGTGIFAGSGGGFNGSVTGAGTAASRNCRGRSPSQADHARPARSVGLIESATSGVSGRRPHDGQRAATGSFPRSACRADRSSSSS